jgi:AcrR family transcriptional regulator
MSTDDGGLRERKKHATRQALSAAALRLAREHGPQNVRVDDIAEAAGVSPRTYNNYFSSREQAIVVALAAEPGARVAAALRKRPADEPLEHAVVGALIEQYSDDGEPDRATLALITSAPALQAEFLDTIAAIERPLAEAISACTGTDGQSELGARGTRRRGIRRSPGRRPALAATRTRHHVLRHAERGPHLDRPRPARSRPVTSARRLRHDPHFGLHAPSHVHHGHR